MTPHLRTLVSLRVAARRLRGDRGDGDITLSIGAMVASLIAVSVIGGVIGFVVLNGQRFLRTQEQAIEVSNADGLFSQDASNALAINELSSSRVQFVLSKSGGSCRIDDWKIVDQVLEARSHTVGADCVLPVAQDDHGQLMRRIEFVSGARITAVNAARQDVVTGVDGCRIVDVKTQAADAVGLSAGEKDDRAPRVLQLCGTIDSEIHGPSHVVFSGVTKLQQARGFVAGSGGSEVAPSWVTYTPAKPTVSVIRSATNGVSVGGLREGVEISWKGVACGPYSTNYSIAITSTTSGVKSQTAQQLNTYSASLSQDFAGIPNGSHVTASVTATCPPGLDGKAKSAAGSASYIQKLPPVIAKISQNSVFKHTISWTPTRISSLPTTLTVTATDPLGRAKSIGSSTSATSMAATWPAGAYGTYSYVVTAKAGQESTTSARITTTVKWPAPSAPGIRVSPASVTPGQTVTITANPSSAARCPAGTSAQYSITALSTGTTWVRTVGRSASVSVSDYWSSSGTYSYRVTLTCVNTYGHGGSASSSGSVVVYVPAPSAPSGFSSGGSWTRMCAGGFVAHLLWTTGVYTDRVYVEASYTKADGSNSGWVSAGWSSTGELTWGDGRAAPNADVQYRLQAVGPGGSSNWVYGTAHFNAGCL